MRVGLVGMLVLTALLVSPIAAHAQKQRPPRDGAAEPVTTEPTTTGDADVLFDRVYERCFGSQHTA